MSPASDAPDDFALAIQQARDSGYANCFEAVAGEVVWRPHTFAGSDRPMHIRGPQRCGAQSAIVVGPDGGDCPNWRVTSSIATHWGACASAFTGRTPCDATCWVRVAQRSAGGGMGAQFLPRIGQEVTGPVPRKRHRPSHHHRRSVQRPGRRRCARRRQAATPAASDDVAGSFKPAHDHAALPDRAIWLAATVRCGMAHPATARVTVNGAQWGVRSKEFGGAGYNQLLFDDTDSARPRAAASTHAGTELNLGHLIHSADNYRGSFRGQGAELRTDAYGAVRAAPAC
jgi:type VI secretion system secreted protein VgrG